MHVELISVHGKKWRAGFLLTHIDIQLFYPHLLDRLSFPHKALFWEFVLKQVARAYLVYFGVFYPNALVYLSI